MSAARTPLEKPIDLSTWIAALGARDRVNVERHVAALEAEPLHATLWRRVATTLATLAPHAASTTGQQAVQFFVAGRQVPHAGLRAWRICVMARS